MFSAAPSSNGQDKCFSSIKSGFDSPWGHKVEKANCFAFSHTCDGRSVVFAAAKTASRVRNAGSISQGLLRFFGVKNEQKIQKVYRLCKSHGILCSTERKISVTI